MRHDWVFDVLDDLRTYALSNGLPRTAAKVAEALAIARDEIAPGPPSTRDPQEDGPGGVPPGGRSH